MPWVKKKDQPAQVNMLPMKFRRNAKWLVKKKTGTAVIFVPRFSTSRGEKVGYFFDLGPDRRIHMDQYGTSVWRLMNGRNTVERIGKRLMRKYGDDMHQVYDRLSTFIMIMERAEMVKRVKEGGDGIKGLTQRRVKLRPDGKPSRSKTFGKYGLKTPESKCGVDMCCTGGVKVKM